MLLNQKACYFSDLLGFFLETVSADLLRGTTRLQDDLVAAAAVTKHKTTHAAVMATLQHRKPRATFVAISDSTVLLPLNRVVVTRRSHRRGCTRGLLLLRTVPMLLLLRGWVRGGTLRATRLRGWRTILFWTLGTTHDAAGRDPFIIECTTRASPGGGCSMLLCLLWLLVV